MIFFKNQSQLYHITFLLTTCRWLSIVLGIWPCLTLQLHMPSLTFSFSHLLPGSVGAGTEGIKESYFLHRLFVFAFFFFFFNWRTAALQYCVGPSTHQHELATGTLHRLAARSLSAPPTPLSPDILDASSF